MKVILESKIGSIEATSEDSNYPVVNLLDDHPKKKYMVGSNDDTYTEIKIGTAGATGGLGLVNIIADRASIYIENPNGIVWQDTSITWDNVDWEEYPDSLKKEIIFSKTQEYNTLWVEFHEFQSSVDIIIKLYLDNVYDDKKISAGVVKVGVIREIKDIIYPVNISLIDYSYEKMLANGSIYYKKRDIVQKIRGSVLVDYNTYIDFMFSLAKKYGKIPAMWNIEEQEGCDNLILYGRLSILPQTNIQNIKIRTIDFELTEVL